MPLIFHRLHTPLMAAATLILGGCCAVCEPAAVTAPVTVIQTQPRPLSNVVDPGDVLDVAVAGEEDLSGIYTVAADGTIGLPLIGAVLVAGREPSAVPEVIAAAYRDGYLVDPQVSVNMMAGGAHE